MILGTRNFNQEYNGTFVGKKEAFKMLDYFQNNGGKIIDTAYNYKGVYELLNECGYKGKIQTKVKNELEFYKSFDILKTDYIYSVLSRDNDNNIYDFLRKKQDDKIIEKFGISCYLPQELTKSYYQIIQIPCDPIWFKYIKTMSLYADIQYRSYFNHYKQNYKEIKEPLLLKENNKIDFVVGCDSLEQLKINMELFK